jgi:Uma2 family endonuclease
VMGVQLARRLFTVAEYHKMAEAGILSEDDRVELLEGEIVAMSPIGSRHAGLVNRLNRLFSQRAGDQVVVSVQNPVRLGGYSEPQPDLALLRPRADFYTSSHPGPEDVLLAVEVAETSAAVDREVKVPLYARFGVPEVWLVDLAGGPRWRYSGSRLRRGTGRSGCSDGASPWPLRSSPTFSFPLTPSSAETTAACLSGPGRPDGPARGILAADGGQGYNSLCGLGPGDRHCRDRGPRGAGGDLVQ